MQRVTADFFLESLMNQLRGLTGEDLAQSGAVNGAAHAGVEVAVKVLRRIDAGNIDYLTVIFIQNR